LNLLPLVWRLARRDFRGGLGQFRIFLACLAIGVAAIGAVGSVSAAVVAGLKADARVLLGGDVDLRLVHRPNSAEQDAYLLSHSAALSRMVEMRAMARPAQGFAVPAVRPALVELKAVDDAYPLVGAVALSPGLPLAEALQRKDGFWGAVADANLLNRLGLEVGQRIRVGEATLEVRAAIEAEPDRVASVFDFGPRLMIAAEALPATALVQPGSLIRYHTRVLLAPGTAVEDWVQSVEEAFPQAGWRIRDVSAAAPGVERFVERMALFLTFIGLSALLVGGIGISNAVRAYLNSKTATIATFKCLGAAGHLVFWTYFLQILVLALVGIGFGLVIGAALPAVGLWLLDERLPIRADAGLYPVPLALAALFGLLTAVVFALWPLGQAREVPPANLFRSAVMPFEARPRLGYIIALAAAAVALGVLTVISAGERNFAAIFVAGAIASLLLLRGGAAAVMALTRRLPRLPGSSMPLALANLHRPGAPTPAVMVSLGIGMAVLVAVTLIEGALRAQIQERVPESAPALFFIDIQDAQAEAFDAAVGAVAGVGDVRRVPAVRGRIVEIAGVPVDQAEVAPEAQWAVQGDRALTAAAEPPDHAEIAAGAWWPAGYDGPPLMSLDAGLARGFGVDVGDHLTLNVLGRELNVEIASLRRIDWQAIPFDFAVILSPAALAGAPITHVAAVFADAGREDAVENVVAVRFSNITAVRVRDALDAVNAIIRSIGDGVRAAGSITVAAGLLVLAGAMAADRRRRAYDSVLFKVLGATRPRLARLYIATAIGTAAAWAVTVFVMRTDWVFLPATAALIVALCVVVTTLVGFAGTFRILGRKAAPYLRNE
jgi:putative ABC transport system permease protein